MLLFDIVSMAFDWKFAQPHTHTWQFCNTFAKQPRSLLALQLPFTIVHRIDFDF